MKKYGFIVLLLALFIVIVFLGTNQSQTFSKKSPAANESKIKAASDTDVNQIEPVLAENRSPQELIPARGGELLAGLGISVASNFVPADEELEEELVESEESEESGDLNEPLESEAWTYESEEESSSTNSNWSNYSPSYSGNGSSSRSSNGSSWQPSTQWTPPSNNHQTNTKESAPAESTESESHDYESQPSAPPKSEEEPIEQPVESTEPDVPESTESSSSESSIESYSIRDDDGDGVGHYNDSNDADPNIQ